jgi:hypothetical protein
MRNRSGVPPTTYALVLLYADGSTSRVTVSQAPGRIYNVGDTIEARHVAGGRHHRGGLRAYRDLRAGAIERSIAAVQERRAAPLTRCQGQRPDRRSGQLRRKSGRAATDGPPGGRTLYARRTAPILLTRWLGVRAATPRSRRLPSILALTGTVKAATPALFVYAAWAQSIVFFAPGTPLIDTIASRIRFPSASRSVTRTPSFLLDRMPLVL